MEQRRIKMTTPRLALADELAEIRAEIARLKQRETALASIEHDFPVIPVFRRSWPMQRQDQSTLVHV
ncbi:MAG: hypothetical protein C0524_03540 [Rhodobacter sp.]|nr:hypothetical protein [Rhodobacter sp.]